MADLHPQRRPRTPQSALRGPLRGFARACALACALALALAADTTHAHDPRPTHRSVIVQQRPAKTASEERVEADVITTAPRRRSADDLLRLVPGVWAIQHGAEGKGQQIFLRGFDAAHGTDVAVSVDGVVLNESSNIHGHGYVDMNFVIPELVRRIHARKGPFDLRDGNFATAGAIDLELGVDEAQRGARLGYQLSAFGRHRLLAVFAPAARRRRSFAGLEAMHDPGFAAGRRARRITAIGRTTLHDSPQLGALDLTGSAYAADFGAPGALRVDDIEAGRIDRLGALRSDTGGASVRGLLVLRHRQRRVGALDHHLYAQARQLSLIEDFSGYLLDPERGDRRRQRHRIFGGGYRLTYDRPLSERTVLLFGAAWIGERITQSEAAVDEDHRVVAPRWDLDIDQHQLGAFVGLRQQLSPWLTAEAGARLDLFAYQVHDRQDPTASPSRLALTAASPRLLLRARLSPAWHIFSSLGRGLRAPEARSIIPSPTNIQELPGASARYRGGDPRVTSSDALELGARRERRRLSAGLALFGTWIARELLYDHVSGVNLEQHRTRRIGGELDLRVRPRDWFELRGGLTLVSARFVDSGAPVPNAPPLLATLGGVATHRSGLSGAARLTVLGPRPLPYGAVAGALALVDLSASYRHGHLQLDLAIDNLFNSRWAEGTYNFASWQDKSAPRSALPALHTLAGPPFTLRLGATIWL